MNKRIIRIIIIVVSVLLIYNLLVGGYNQLVTLNESVASSWSNVETQYQRRYDLIPNLVNTVKGFAEQEKEVLTGVIEARAKATSMQIDPSNLTSENIQQFAQVQGQLNSALSRLLVTVERYPDLKSNQNFLELQAQLEGTENRIAVARNRYNEQAQVYNGYRNKFPRVLYASFFGFEAKPYYKADEAAETAPTVEF